jgi:hypothetical protein
MEIKGSKYQFDRIVKVTLVPFGTSKNSKGVYENIQGNGAITFLFDTQHSQNSEHNGSQYCTRIDFSVKQYGRVDATSVGRSIAKISVYNIESKISQLLDAYNVYDEKINLQQTTTWKINLQVGFNGMSMTTLFSGTVNSFAKDRVQDSDKVDTVWNFYCNSRSSGNSDINFYSCNMKALPGENYSFVNWGVGNKAVTYEEAIKQIIYNKSQDVIEFFNVKSIEPSGIKKLIGKFFSDSATTTTYSVKNNKPFENLTPLEYLKEITPGNFDKYFKIRYAGSVLGKENESLKKKWKTNKTKGVTVSGDTLEEGLGQLAKKLDNCFALIKDDPNDTRRVILIFPAGCVSKRTVALGKKWTIRNFANLLSEPAIDDNCIKLSFIMEPRMLVNDYITLTIDDEIGRSGASFNLTSGAAYDQKMFTSTGMTGGAVGSVNTYNKNSAKKYGNIDGI